MDFYKTLGLSRDATKAEIKEAFRRSALDHHPDRHALSPEAVRAKAALRFRQASEAYEVLSHDRKRADYDLRIRRAGGGFGGEWSGRRTSTYGGRGYGGGRSGMDMEYLFRFMTTRGFLVSLAFASLLIGGAVVAETGVDTLWKMNNAGVIGCLMGDGSEVTFVVGVQKSFEDAMKSIEEVRVQKENS